MRRASLLVLSLSCSGSAPPATVAGCPDAACREALVLAAWAEGPPAGEEALSQVADPSEQLALALAIIEAHPGRTGQLCGVLRDPVGREFCDKANKRPHLWAAPKEKVTATRAAPGPLEARLTFPAGESSPLISLAPASPEALGCPAPPAGTPCITAAAEAALDEDDTAAAAACLALPEGAWRSECFFGLGEARGASSDPADYAPAVDLCAAAGSFADNCVGHVTTRRAVARATAVCQGDPAAWAEVAREGEAVAAAWTPRGAPHRAAAVGRFWSAAFARALDTAPALGGDALEHVPAEALPQLRAVLAARLLALEGTEERSLDEWVARLEEVLAARLGTTEPWSCRRARVTGRPSWPVDESPEEAAIPATNHRVSARRALSDDPAADGAIVVLEAAAREPGRPQAALLREGLDHPDGLVRWTAERLLAP